MIKYIVATGNRNKVKEFNRILESLNIEATSAKDNGIDMDNAIEDGKTFAENSMIKAKYAYSICNSPVISDDSGLCIDALNGAPGVYSARFAGDGASDMDKCLKVLKELEGVPLEKRTACFHCCITCILSDDDIIQVEGLCPGSIGFSCEGDKGFGYDPIFIPDEPGNITMATLGGDHKDLVGHRGKAMRMLKEELMKRI